MSLVRNILTLVGIVAICVLYSMVGKYRNIPPQIVRDTIVIEKPMPYAVEKVRTEYVYVHTPADTVVIERVDSVLIAVDIERRVYQDSLYRAVVSGAVVGNIHPSLDEIDIYANTETKVVTNPPRLFRPYISTNFNAHLLGVGGGIRIKDKVDIGAKLIHTNNENMLVFETSYSF